MAYTIDDLNALVQAASGDELPIWDVSATGNEEPTKKITLQNLAAAIKTLASLLGTGDVVNDLTTSSTDKPASAYIVNNKEPITITYPSGWSYSDFGSYRCGHVVHIAGNFIKDVATQGTTIEFNNAIPEAIRPGNRVDFSGFNNQTDNSLHGIANSTGKITFYRQETEDLKNIVFSLTYII